MGLLVILDPSGPLRDIVYCRCYFFPDSKRKKLRSISKICQYDTLVNSHKKLCKMFCYINTDSVILANVSGGPERCLESKYRSEWNPPSRVAFSSSGELLAIGYNNGAGCVFNVVLNEWLFQVDDLLDAEKIKSIVFSPDDELLVCAGRESMVVRRARTGETIVTINGCPSQVGLEFTKDGQSLVCTDFNWICVYDTTTWTPTMKSENANISYVMSSRLIMNDLGILTLGTSNLFLWDFNPSQELTEPIFEFDKPDNGSYLLGDLAVTPDDSHIIALFEKSLIVWNTQDASIFHMMDLGRFCGLTLYSNYVIVYQYPGHYSATTVIDGHYFNSERAVIIDPAVMRVVSTFRVKSPVNQIAVQPTGVVLM
jgi:WD40 repeat protein